MTALLSKMERARFKDHNNFCLDTIAIILSPSSGRCPINVDHHQHCNFALWTLCCREQFGQAMQLMPQTPHKRHEQDSLADSNACQSVWASTISWDSNPTPCAGLQQRGTCDGHFTNLWNTRCDYNGSVDIQFKPQPSKTEDCADT